MSKKDVAHNFDNFETYENKVKNLSDKELKMYHDFYESIKSRAKSQRAVTLNNLKDSKETLEELKANASKLKDSVFYHAETAIVDRQDVIADTEGLIHHENKNVLEFEFLQSTKRVDSIDYLNKANIQSKLNFFEIYKDRYSTFILDYDNLYKYFEERVKDFDSVLKNYQTNINEEFIKLDNKISDMDIQISSLIQEKNTRLKKINSFYSSEMEHYLDNNQTFNLEDDKQSIEYQKMMTDKLDQVNKFKTHLMNQEMKIKHILKEEYQDIYHKTYASLLREKGQSLVKDTNFFLKPEAFIEDLKVNIIEAEENNDKHKKSLIKLYNKALKYKEVKAECEVLAKQKTKPVLVAKRKFFLEYQLETSALINQLEKYYEIYIELLKVDPFLAQIVGEQSTTIIRDELDHLSINQVNKEQEINIDFDIKTLKLKQKINELENRMAYLSEKLMINQDIELLETLKDMQQYFTTHQYDSVLFMANFTKERLQLDRLEKAINIHLDYLNKENNLNRKFQSLITKLFEENIRQKESHKITIASKASEIKLALKEYDILAIHYNTMYENEKRFLVMQSNRVNEETKINNEFVLTTFENQMRFSAEQINLANDEYRLRVEAIMKAIDEERIYYRDIVKHRLSGYKERQNILSNDYQAVLYKNSLTLSDISEKKEVKGLNKEIIKAKSSYELEMETIEREIDNDPIISDARQRLKSLDKHLSEALENAQVIRDNTIAEMNEIYSSAEDKYKALVPYLEDKVNPLEPTFFNSLENINKRHQLKIEKAQKELNENTKDLMNDYIKEYFKDNPGIDQSLFKNQMNDVINQRENLKLEYENNIAQNEELYLTRMQSLETERESVITKISSNINQVNHRHSKNINHKKIELENLEKTYDSISKDIERDALIDIKNLSNEYNKSLQYNEKFYKNLNKSFDNILSNYQGYIKMSIKDKAVKKVLKDARTKYRKSNEKLKEKLMKESKSNSYLLD